jgi:hypothetical protein
VTRYRGGVSCPVRRGATWGKGGREGSGCRMGTTVMCCSSTVLGVYVRRSINCYVCEG